MLNLKSNLLRNILKLTSGNLFAQSIQLATIPILTRVYTPEELGLFALFMSFLAIANSFITAKYDSAILLTKTHIDSINMSALIVLLSFSISFFILICIVVYNNYISSVLTIKNLPQYFYFLPLMTFMFGVYQTIYFLNLKLEQFNVVKTVMIRRSYVRSISQIVFGLLHLSTIGLILGQFISTLSGIGYSIKKIVFYAPYMNYINHKRILVLARKHIDFPKYYLPSSVLNISAYEVFSTMIGYSFSMATLGFFIIGKKAIGMPSRLISTTIKNVFMQELTNNLHKNVSSHHTFLDLLVKLTVISIVLFGSMFFIIEDLFLIVFGEHWNEAGRIAKYLLPYYGLNFIVMPLSVVLVVYEKQKLNFLWQVGLICITIVIFILQIYMDLALYDFLLIFSFTVSIHLLILLGILYNTSKSTHIKRKIDESLNDSSQ